MKVLVISVHPDDETLGCGGTILKHVNTGDQVSWLIVTNVKVEFGYSESKVIERNLEIEKVSMMYGFKNTKIIGYKPAGLNSETQFHLINEIGKIFFDLQPEIIYLVNKSDAHSDHKYTFDACMANVKSFRAPYIKRVLMYECLSETEFSGTFSDSMFIPNYLVDISNYIDNKIEIMKVYKSELDEHPFPRNIDNIKSLARLRGSTAGVQYAEAFHLVKYIDK
jgi:LmbE family N-acetylglucosaminyl deacetylase